MHHRAKQARSQTNTGSSNPTLTARATDGARLAQGRQRLRALVEGLQVLQQPCQVLPARDTRHGNQSVSMRTEGLVSTSSTLQQGAAAQCCYTVIRFPAGTLHSKHFHHPCQHASRALLHSIQLQQLLIRYHMGHKQ